MSSRSLAGPHPLLVDRHQARILAHQLVGEGVPDRGQPYVLGGGAVILLVLDRAQLGARPHRGDARTRPGMAEVEALAASPSRRHAPRSPAGPLS